MSELRVLHRVPFIGQHGGSSLLFNQGIPEDPASTIQVIHDGLPLKLSVDRGCVDPMMGAITDDLLQNWINISVVAVLVEVIIANVPADLGLFVIEKETWPKGDDIINSPDPVTRGLAEQYAALGCRVMLSVLHVTNRLVSWAYAEHGHHWLSTREASTARMMSNNNEFKATAVYDGSRHVRWCPPNRDSPIVFVSDSTSALSRDDWSTAASFVGETRRSDAVGEMMSHARAHLDNGHARGAVIEAVSALEMAVDRFASNPEIRALRSDRSFPNASFRADLKHLGFTRSVRYLLPLLISPSILTLELLYRVNGAIQCRHNIVHGQHRKLDVSTAWSHVRAADAVIGVLRAATRGAP